MAKFPVDDAHQAASDGSQHGPTRRDIVIAMVAGALTFGFVREASAEVGFPTNDAPLPAGFEPTIWCRIDPDGTVTVNIICAEMGQHVGTALARILAEELEADWSRVRIEQVDTDPRWGVMMTGGSWSVWQSWDVLGRAGAAARIGLIEEGARLLQTTPGVCIARNGSVIAGSHSISYGDIVARGHPARRFTNAELQAITLKPPSERRLLGLPVAALDIPSKTNGSGIYGIDIRIDGMVYARPKIAPTRNGSKVVSVDDSAARALKGYLRSIVIDDPSGTVPGWVMVYADSTWGAMRAADLVKVVWTPGKGEGITDITINDHGRTLINDPATGVFLFDDPGVDQALVKAGSKIERSYTTSTVMHLQLEPSSGVAQQKDGVYEIHSGNQWQSLALPVLAKALGVGEDKVVLKTYLLGGGFGRRLNGDYLVGIALASKAIGGKPVKMVLTRADDMRFDSPRSPSVQLLRMAFGGDKQVVAMEHHAAAGWPTEVMAPALMTKGLGGKLYDSFAISGADHWYDVGPLRVRAVSNDLANATIRPGWLRSVGSGWVNWALESFMDEAAHEAGADPVAFRLAMLNGHGRNAGTAPNSVGGALRQAAVLRRLAEKAGWGKAVPAGTALGIATSFGQERGMPTWIACAALVLVDVKTGVVRCLKLTIVCDAGTVVDPGGAAAQCEGAALWGLSMALFEGTTLINGMPSDTNLDTYTPVRLADTPEIDLEFMPSTEKPMGLGEPATTVVAPAIGNAIFNATGARMRHLPIRPADVQAELQRQT